MCSPFNFTADDRAVIVLSLSTKNVEVHDKVTVMKHGGMSSTCSSMSLGNCKPFTKLEKKIKFSNVDFCLFLVSNKNGSVSSGIHSQSSFSEEQVDLNCSEEMPDPSASEEFTSICLSPTIRNQEARKEVNQKEALGINNNLCFEKSVPVSAGPSAEGIEEGSNLCLGENVGQFEDIIDEILGSNDPLKYIPFF